MRLALALFCWVFCLAFGQINGTPAYSPPKLPLVPLPEDSPRRAPPPLRPVPRPPPLRPIPRPPRLTPPPLRPTPPRYVRPPTAPPVRRPTIPPPKPTARVYITRKPTIRNPKPPVTRRPVVQTTRRFLIWSRNPTRLLPTRPNIRPTLWTRPPVRPPLPTIRPTRPRVGPTLWTRPPVRVTARPTVQPTIRPTIRRTLWTRPPISNRPTIATQRPTNRPTRPPVRPSVPTNPTRRPTLWTRRPIGSTFSTRPPVRTTNPRSTLWTRPQVRTTRRLTFIFNDSTPIRSIRTTIPPRPDITRSTRTLIFVFPRDTTSLARRPNWTVHPTDRPTRGFLVTTMRA